MDQHRVLLTGGCGFIGSTLVRKLIARGDHVTVLDAMTYAGNLGNLEEIADHPLLTMHVGDICDRELVRRIQSEEDFSAVIHLAAQTHVDRSIDNAEPFVRTNVLGTQVLLEETARRWAGLTQSRQKSFRFLQVSTDEVFGSLDSDDGLFSESSRYDPRSPYAASKAAADHLVSAWFHTHGLPVLTTYSGNNYGPRQHSEKLIPLVITRAISGEPIPIYGSGRNVRDWVHVDDHAQGLLDALDRGVPGSTYCFSARDEHTNLEVVALVLAALEELRPPIRGKQYRDLISFVVDRPGHDWRYAMDPSKAERELGFHPQKQLATTMTAVVRSYVENLR